ncbi:MAG TPA: diguanylate cyclase [Stenomitos sp.]
MDRNSPARPSGQPRPYASTLQDLAVAFSASTLAANGTRTLPALKLPERPWTPLDLDTVLLDVLSKVAQIAKADRGFISLVDEAGGPIYSLVLGGTGDVHTLFPYCTTLLQDVMTERRSLWIDDAQRHPLLQHSDSVFELGLRSLIVLPLLLSEAVVGVIYVDRSSLAEPLTPPERSILESFATYAALAVHSVWANNEMSARVRKLQLINEVSLAISATRKIERLLSLILQHSLSLSGGDQGYILLGTHGDLKCLASLDSSGRPLETLAISRSIVSRCIDERRAICILDTGLDAANQTASVMALDLRSVICVPLVASQQQLGALYISSNAITKTFTAQDQSLLEAIANQAALTIQNAQLLEEQERQIHELERALQLVHEAQIKAVTDGLTGLFNHLFFKEQLINAMAEAERYGTPLSVIMVDLDHFKRINDTYGHQTGDEVLRQASACLRQTVRDSDIVARYGGEEMAVLLPHTDGAGGALAAERIRAAIAAMPLRTIAGEPFTVTASLGVASLRAGSTAVELLERADKALYTAKHRGRNQVGLDDPSAAKGLAPDPEQP